MRKGFRYWLGIFKDYQFLKTSEHFDPNYYLLTYRDVRQADVNPLLHYVRFGWKECRDPSASFSTRFYLEKYRDVKLSGMNPLVHFVRYGIKEGRQCNPWVVNEPMENEQMAWLPSRREVSAPPPQVRIIIPVYNALAMTRACLESLDRTTAGIDLELFVVDNASHDGTFAWLQAERRRRPNLAVARMPDNVGFGPAVNVGLQRSTADYIVILNNDTIPAPGWLNHLLAVMHADPLVGIVSPMTNFVGHGPQIDPDARDLPPKPAEIERYARSIAGRFEPLYVPNRLVFFCVMLRRSLVDQIGSLDEIYRKGNFEDDDYCLRTRMAGYRLAIARSAFVYHHGSTTFKLNRISHSHWMEVNRDRFFRKAGRIATSSRPWSPASSICSLSVIVRTKDRPALLRKALTSLANQTRRDFEVVLVNDGGADVADLVQAFTPFFPVVYVYHEKPKGRTAAMNAGLSRARGEWIAYLDDDDILYPWHFESLLQAAQESGSRVVYSDSNRVLFLSAESSTPVLLTGAPPWKYNRRELLVSNYLPVHTYIHTRELGEQAGPWNEQLDRLEDYEFLLRLNALADFHHLDSVTCEYRYYLDNVNSIFLGRAEYRTALEQVYAWHPVEDAALNKARQRVLEALDEQSEKIAEILRDADSGEADMFAARREIIRITTGL